MKIPLVDIKKQYLNIKEEIDSAIKRVIESCEFVGGEEITSFENEFSKYCGVKYGVAVSSGSTALDLALMACGISHGNEVITTPNTFIATTEAITHAGAKIVFADIDPHTYTICPNEINRVITPRTKAIIVVHLFGHPCDMAPIMDIAKKYNLFVIEDCAQSHGAVYNHKKVGQFGIASCFSFFPSKNLGAFGHAGIVLTNDKEIADRVRMLSVHGSYKKYDHIKEGFNYRVDAIQTAILRVKLKYLDKWNDMRRNNAQIYNKLLEDLPIETPKELHHAKHVYHLYVIKYNKRDELANWLKSKGIGVAIHYPIPLHLQRAYKYLGYKKGSFPVAEDFCSKCLSLPMFPELTQEQIEFIVNEIKNFINKYGA